MKNTLHSQLFYLSNCCFNFKKKLSVVLIFSALFLVSNMAHAQLPLFDSFEGNFGNWNDGGNDASREATLLLNGYRALRIRDNSGGNSSIFSDQINLTPYTSVTIQFIYYPISMETGENFFVEYDDGGGYTVIGNYRSGIEFNNGSVYSASITIDSGSFTFSNNSRFRIRCDASDNDDQIYIDDINITDCVPGSGMGTSALGCPFVELGGLGLGSTAPPTVDCSVGETTIEASYLELGDTSRYTVESIPYSPPYQLSCLENRVSVGLDDTWSPIINLPFDFCFYNNTYSSLVIGANGVISFDTSLANSPSGWRTTRNIPNIQNARDGNGPYYFGPSIFGAHHDVDPSRGGEIGYQLITLNTGCQALVAAWSDVPMYYNNSILYSGMIVFYENTNVIEIYIKEKNLDSGNWNDRNASIGLQANQNTATVVPGRNTLDPNWTTTNEAWRFVPDGAPITTLKWYEGSISAANEITDPNNDNQITVSPTSDTTYFAEVTYTLCNGSTIVETSSTDVTITGNKTWNGSQSTDWDDADNWTPNGVPTIDDCITIPPTSNNPRLNNPTNGLGYNMQILDGADLLHRPNATLTIDDRIVIEPNGSYRLRTNASLIQINDVAANENIGEAEVRRRVNGVGYFDYVYWSSPVSNFNVLDISPGSPSHSIFNWNPSVANGTAGRHGTWTNTTEDMISGKGYIVRGLLGTPATNQVQFEGTLNNGQISYPIFRGTYTGADYTGIGNTATAEDDNWNLLGNPYPSAISLSDFIAANPAIDGTLYFWRHIDPAATAIDDPFYEGYQYNYNPNDYLSANSLGSTPSGFNGYIASGQGFFALMLDSAPTPNVVNFNNTMRGLYANNVFYRNSSPTGLENKHRIWLDLVNEDNTALPILIGFADGATNGIDRLYDGISINQSENQFYSLASDKKLSIQGKPLPFDNSETIPLGYKTAISGSFKITINKLDGLFEGASQDIFIEDTKLNIIHNLKDSPYSFTTDEGTYNNRFIVRFTPQALSINDQDIIADLNIKSINKTINVRSTLSLIKTFELFDLTGRTIHKNVNIDDNTYNYQDNNLSAGAYIVQVTLINGSVVSKKIVI